MLNLNTSIKEAFFERNCFVTYYNLLNTFFQEDRIGVIHDAKTISVAIRCTELHQTYGFSYPILLESLREIFTEPSQLRLSQLIDLSDLELFEWCIVGLQAKHDTRGGWSAQINIGQKVA
jgi:hypothetical protein